MKVEKLICCDVNHDAARRDDDIYPDEGPALRMLTTS